MRLHGIAQLVDTLNRSIACCIKANGVIRAYDIIINRTGYADARHALAGKCLRATEGTVAAAANQSVDAKIFAGIRRLLQPLLGHHLFAARGIQHRATATDDTVDTACTHLNDVTVDKTAVTTADTKHGNIICGCGSNDRANQCIHTGGVAAAGEYANSTNLLVHNEPPCIGADNFHFNSL